MDDLIDDKNSPKGNINILIFKILLENILLDLNQDDFDVNKNNNKKSEDFFDYMITKGFYYYYY